MAQDSTSFDQALAELKALMGRETDNYQHPEAEAAFNGAMSQANKAWPSTVIPPQQGAFPQPMKLGGPMPQGVTFDGPPPQSVNALTQGAPQQGQNALSSTGYPLDERGQPVVSPRDVRPGQPQPGYGPVRQYFNGIAADLAQSGPSDWLDAAGAFGGALGDSNALSALGTAANPAARYMKNGPFEQLSARGNIGNRAMSDAKEAANVPPHMLLGRDPKTGQFTRMSDETKAVRQQGRAQLDAEARSARKYPQGVNTPGFPFEDAP